MHRLAIFDLDDTLLDTSDVYWRSRTAFLDIMDRAGFERSTTLEDFELIDGQNIALDGYVPERYGKSMVETYYDLCRRQAVEPIQTTVEAIRRAGAIVRLEAPELIAGARALLDGARGDGMRVVLVTRGVDEVQLRKIASHQLQGHFDRIEVVASKSAKLFTRLIADAGASPQDCWIVGDSIRSDINPGIEAGANCILYLYTHHAYHWRQEYGAQPRGTFYVAKSLQEVLQIMREPKSKVRIEKVPERDLNLPS